MCERRATTRFASDTVTAMMRAASLQVQEDQLGAIAELLDAAAEAASHLDEAASRIPLSDALLDFDPTWREGDR